MDVKTCPEKMGMLRAETASSKPILTSIQPHPDPGMRGLLQ
jgi:hypothetical protein